MGRRAEGRNRGERGGTTSQTGQWLWQERVRAEENQRLRSPRRAEQADGGRSLATGADWRNCDACGGVSDRSSQRFCSAAHRKVTTGLPRDGRFNGSMILGKMRTRAVPAVPVLMTALQDQVREVRCQIVFVLGQIGPETKKEPEPKSRAGIHRPERACRSRPL